MSHYLSLEQQWAECNFKMAQLGDQRLIKRLKMVAAAIASDPAGSIPRQMGDWGQTKAAYRFFNHERVTFESVSQPHWNQTRLLAGESEVTLLLQDTTWLSFLQHPATTGLGRFGNGSGWGLLLHSVLAVQPQHDGKGGLLGAAVLGVAHAKIWARHQQVTGVGRKRN